MQLRLAVRLAAFMAGAVLVALVFLVHTPRASACGCFTPPDPSVPIVQAGERIAFQIENGIVTAHIQIQYSGKADEFGWLLPLPAVPELGPGTDELFVQLIQQTQPLYKLVAEYKGNCSFDPNRSGGGNTSVGGGGDSASPPEAGGGDPLVFREAVGPYDAVVLRADSKDEMLQWLEDNGFFVPAGTDDAVTPYIREGAYFLALKLLKGKDQGDIQPIVVKYASDYPMIPLVLTSVAADPDMPIMAWVLGDARAIPRNYYHTKLNDAELDWLNAGDNYIKVVTDAVDETPGRPHSFVTEFAGSSSIMVDLLDDAERFGDLDQLRAITGAVNFVEYLIANRFTTVGATSPPFFAPSFTSQVLAILQAQLPVPAKLLDWLTEQGGTVNDYYLSMGYYVDSFRSERPDLFEDLDLEFDPVALTNELEERVVIPTRAAGELFRKNPYMTRLFTTMSPNEMTVDPVFSFNPELRDVSNVHEGRLIYYCGIIGNDSPTTTPARIITESGWQLKLPHGTQDNPWKDVGWPKSQRIEVEHEEGESEVIVDNTDEIAAFIEARSPSSGGCSAGAGSGAAGGLGLAAFAALVLAGRRRRGERRPG